LAENARVVIGLNSVYYGQLNNVSFWIHRCVLVY